MKKLILLCSLAILIFACSKREDVSLNKQDVLQENKVKVLQLDDCLEIISSFNSDYATFKNVDQLIAFVSFYIESSQEDKEKMLSSLPYKTTTEIMNEFYKALNNVQSESELISLVDNLSYLVTIKKDNINGPSISEREISYHSAYPFFNKDQILKIGDYFYRFMGNSVGSSQSYTTLTAFNSEQELKNSDEYLGIAVSFINLDSDGSVILRDNDIGHSYVTYKTKESDRCKNRRRVRFTAAIPESFIYQDGPIDVVIRRIITSYLEIKPERQGWFCYWRGYRTVIDWRNCRFKCIIKYRPYPGGPVMTFLYDPAYRDEVRESRRWTREGEIIDYLPNIHQFQLIEVDLVRLTSNITTRGIWPLWLIVDKYDI